MKLAWFTDLHLDRADEERRATFYGRLRWEGFDSAVITGDISNARQLSHHLRELAQACGSRKKIYFVLGNHDFYGSSFDEVDRAVSAVCREHGNLFHLGQDKIERLSENTALIGHRGWADGRAGWGSNSNLRNPDQFAIEDLRCCSKKALFGKMEELGRASGNYFREVLPYTLTCYQHVLVATHVPPFTQAAFFDGKPCGRHHLPHYTNRSAGCAITGISGHFPKSRITVLCGHTHSAAEAVVGGKVRVLAGQARPGHPRVQKVLEISPPEIQSES